MDTVLARRLTGWSCLAAAAAFIVEVPLYFVYSGPPPDANVLSPAPDRDSRAGIPAHLRDRLPGLRQERRPAVRVGRESRVRDRSRLRRRHSGVEWAGGGAVIEADQAIDPTITVSGTYILYGSIGRMLLGFFLVALGYAVTKTGALPRWTGTSAYVLALVNFAFVPSLFFGNEPSFFYAANGWGTTASMGAILSYWLLMMGIVTLRGRRGAVPLPQGARS